MSTTNPIPLLRAAGLAEAVSFLVLLGVAMPLKYLAGMPQAVKVVGWAHGLLFMGFCAALLLTTVVAIVRSTHAGTSNRRSTV